MAELIADKARISKNYLYDKISCYKTLFSSDRLLPLRNSQYSTVARHLPDGLTEQKLVETFFGLLDLQFTLKDISKKEKNVLLIKVI